MGFFSKDIKTMDDLFVHTLRDIYYAENQILKALPEMIEKATDPQLKQGFQSHLAETKDHVKRARAGVQDAWRRAKGVDCPAIDGIIEDAEEIAGEVDDKQVLDAALIAAAQAVEHYEITRYGTLIALGEAARPQRLRDRAAEESRRGEGRRPQAHRARGSAAQSQGRELARPIAVARYALRSAAERRVHRRPCDNTALRHCAEVRGRDRSSRCG